MKITNVQPTPKDYNFVHSEATSEVSSIYQNGHGDPLIALDFIPNNIYYLQNNLGEQCAQAIQRSRIHMYFYDFS